MILQTSQKKKMKEIINKEWENFLSSPIGELIYDKIEKDQKITPYNLQWVKETCRAVFDWAYLAAFVRIAKVAFDILENEDRVRVIVKGFKPGESIVTIFIFSSHADAMKFVSEHTEMIFEQQERFIIKNFSVSPDSLLEFMPDLIQ